MKVASYIQTAIHVMEAGAGYLMVRYIAVFFVIIGMLGIYDIHCYQNFSAPEAMDNAQLAKNLADGKGYTTLFIRPLSVFLIQRHNAEKYPGVASPEADLGHLKSAHPDIVNPPVYPLMLAGLMKALPLRFEVTTGRYAPEMAITVLNQIFLLLAVLMTYYAGRRLFDPLVGWLSAILMLGSEPLWHFSISGLSTNFLLILFLAILMGLISLEEKSRLYRQPGSKMFVTAFFVGLLVGIGMLTRYSFGILIFPVIGFLLLFSGRRSVGHALTAVAAFGIVVLPWIARNILVSGEPLGLAGFTPAESTANFHGSSLEQLLHPAIENVFVPALYVHKLLDNAPPIFLNELPKLGGSWTGMLFLTGLLMSFRGFAARRFRYFTLACVAMFIITEAVGQTPFSYITPQYNNGNLLILAVPLIFMYAVVFFLQFAGGTHTRGGFFVKFLERQSVQLEQLRFLMASLFVFISCLPLLLSMSGPKPSVYAYPPYFPPDIQKVSSWMQEDELMMSDVPWSVAWYGRHKCMWLTTDDRNAFFELNDYLQPVLGIWLTPQTMDDKMFTGVLASDPNSWSRFAINWLMTKDLPANFPLRVIPAATNGVSSGLFLTDKPRWIQPAPAAP